MAPRFVEVSRPVEAGVEWASQLPSTLTHSISSIIPSNATDIVFERLDGLVKLVPEFKAYSDLRGACAEALQYVPPASHHAKNLAIAGFAVLLLRALFVFLRARSILSNYGAAKVMGKEC